MATTVRRYAYDDRSNDLLLAVESLRRLATELLPKALLFAVFCVVWTSVFILALHS